MNSTIHRIPLIFSIVLFLTIFFGHYGYVMADETSDSVFYEMAEIEVTASRVKTALPDASRIIGIMTQEQINAYPVQSVNDILKYAVGVDVRQRGPMGAQTDVGVRGGNFEQVAILLDGINICDPQTGHNSFDFPVDMSDIDHIEVLEGPAGRAYGSSSLMGAINIVTKTAARTSGQAHLEAGSWGYATGGARAAAVSGGWNNMLSVNYGRSDGYSRSKAGHLNADMEYKKAFYKGGYTDNDIQVNWHAGASIKDWGSNTFYSAKYDEQFEHTVKTYTALQAENRVGRVHIHPSVWWNHNEDRFELIRDSEAQVPFNYHRSDVAGVKGVVAHLDAAGGGDEDARRAAAAERVAENANVAVDPWRTVLHAVAVAGLHGNRAEVRRRAVHAAFLEGATGDFHVLDRPHLEPARHVRRKEQSGE